MLLQRAAGQLGVAFARRGAPPAVSGLVLGSRFNQQSTGQSVMFDEHDAERRQLLYRSKQRGVIATHVKAFAARNVRSRMVSGWLEMDIMLGKWVRLPQCRMCGD